MASLDRIMHTPLMERRILVNYMIIVARLISTLLMLTTAIGMCMVALAQDFVRSIRWSRIGKPCNICSWLDSTRNLNQVQNQV